MFNIVKSYTNQDPTPHPHRSCPLQSKPRPQRQNQLPLPQRQDPKYASLPTDKYSLLLLIQVQTTRKSDRPDRLHHAL